MRITNSYMNRVHGIRLDKREQEFINVARKAAHEAKSKADFKVYAQGLIDGTRTPRKREDKPSARIMKHAIKAARKHNREVAALLRKPTSPVQSRLFDL